MFQWFRKNKAIKQRAQQLYGSIVTQARNAVFYEAFGVPDTVSGRFEMMVIHMFLVLHWLKQGDRASQALGQELVDTFFSSIDGMMREAGVGDLSVPKKMRKFSEAFYASLQAYDEAVKGSADVEGRLAKVLLRTLFEKDEIDTDAKTVTCSEMMARYMHEYLIQPKDEVIDLITNDEAGFQDPETMLGNGRD